MRLFRLSSAAALISVGLAFTWGCAETVDDIDRTKPNALPKSLFDGVWYFGRTTIDAPYETQATFVGDRQEYMFAEDFPAIKIRWRIEEDKLFACRADEVMEGDAQSAGHTNLFANDGSLVEGEEDLTQEKYGELADMGKAKFPCKYPVAAFKIESHFDIGRDYNAATGEQSNVISENTSDRPWHERDYIRVDWTDLGVTDLNFNVFGYSTLGWQKIENIYFVQNEDNDCRVINKDGSVDYSACEEGFLPPVIEDDNIMITNRMTMVPEDGLFSCYVYSMRGYGVPCTLAEIGMRYAFRKIENLPAEQQYEQLYYPDEMFERFGTWRVTKDVYLAGYGTTDLKNYRATRFNLWEKSFKDCQEVETPCSSNDFNCLIEVAEDGHHVYKECSPIPVDERTPKPIDYYLNREFPSDLKPTAFKVAKNWSDAYVGVHPAITEDGCRIQCANSETNEVKYDDDCTVAESQPGSKWVWSMAPTDGHYCMFNLHENNGQQFMGDLRYNMIAHIEDYGMSQPCGVGGPANDPETGELINATAYIYGNCFDYYEQAVLDRIDILCDQEIAKGTPESDLPKACSNPVNENLFMQGYNFREIVAEQGRIKPPATPVYTIAPPDNANRGPNASKDLKEKLEIMRQNARMVQNHRSVFERRAEKLMAEGIDRMMIDDVIAREISGGAATTAAELTDEQVSIVSPLSRSRSLQTENDALVDAYAAKAVEPADVLFTDTGLWAFARAHMDLTREELGQYCREESFRATALHELGHNQGMRHNFRGTFDRVHFPKEYWEKEAAAAEKFKTLYGRAPVSTLDVDDEPDNEADYFEAYRTWASDRDIMHNLELAENIGVYKYSSIMDYHGLMHGDWNGLGSYDKAFMRFLYANKVDVPMCNRGVTPEDCYKSGDLFKINYAQYYLGGERCNADSDCPHAADGQSCDLDPTMDIKLCSNWYADQGGKLNPYIYQFCSDDRVTDDPFCNRFDVGETAEEMIRNMVDSYNSSFIFSKFRRYRTAFSSWGYYNRVFDRYFSMIGNMMQSVLYKYFYEEGFRSLKGPGSWDDMITAVLMGFDFLGNILMKPESGTFSYDRNLKMYMHDDDGWDPDMENTAPENGGMLGIPLGQGEPAYSSYENGYFGEINRVAVIGSYYDKMAALETLTQRYWGASSLSNENRFYLSFYDFLPSSFVRLVGGIIADDTKSISNHFTLDGQLVQRNYWDGRDIMSNDGTGFTGELDDVEGYPVESGAEFYNNLYAIIYGAIDVAYYSDTSFADKMRVFEVGSGSGLDLSVIDASKVAYYTSPVTNRVFAAVENKDGDSVGVRMMKHAQELADRYEMLNNAISTSTVPAEYNNMNEVALDARNLSYKLESLETKISNLVYICDVVGVGRL